MIAFTPTFVILVIYVLILAFLFFNLVFVIKEDQILKQINSKESFNMDYCQPFDSKGMKCPYRLDYKSYNNNNTDNWWLDYQESLLRQSDKRGSCRTCRPSPAQRHMKRHRNHDMLTGLDNKYPKVNGICPTYFAKKYPVYLTQNNDNNYNL